jgi:hypothetical protein
VRAIIKTGEFADLRESERQGMRAYLQRGETRLSTYQRVAGVFLNGAGLLILLPGLARESVYSTIAFVVTTPSIHSLLLMAPWLLSTIIPLYAFVLLLRDIVQFYFSPRFLQSDPLRINRFALAGVTFPFDEGKEAKAQVIALKATDRSYVDFTLGGTSLKTVEKAFKASEEGKTSYPLRLAVKNALKDPEDRNIDDRTPAEYIGVAFALAGSLDQSLVGEVARMEASVCRHVLLLRKLVLRYTKALILFVWTTLISISVAAILAIPPNIPNISIKEKSIICFILYTIWAALAIIFIKKPMFWIDKLISSANYNDNLQESKNQNNFRDPDLEEFENIVTLVLRIAAGIFFVTAIVLAFIP